MKAMVLFSGGVDSTTCLGMAVDKYGAEEVLALSVSYGQKHQKEVEAARKIAAYYGVAWKQLDLSVIFADSNCSLLSGSTQEIPKEPMRNSYRKPTAVRFPPMCRSATDCSSLLRQAWHCPTAAKSFTTEHTVMMPPAMPIRIAAMPLMRQ